MRVEFVKLNEGRGLENLAVFGTNPIGTMLEIAIEMIENLGTEDPDYSEQKNRITTLLYEIEQKTEDIGCKLYELQREVKSIGPNKKSPLRVV